jgi:hypothetical protein
MERYQAILAGVVAEARRGRDRRSFDQSLQLSNDRRQDNRRQSYTVGIPGSGILEVEAQELERERLAIEREPS